MVVDAAAFFAGLSDGTASRGDVLRTPVDTSKAAWQEQLVAWQYVSVAETSPGPVLDSEDLRLSLYDPVHVQDGVLSRMAFSSIDHLGMSTDRCTYTTEDECHQRALRKAAADQRVAWGYIDLSTRFMRSLRHPEYSGPVVGVYDTAVAPTANSPGNPAHAEAFKIAHVSNRVPLKTIQTNLMDEYQDKVARWPRESNDV